MTGDSDDDSTDPQERPSLLDRYGAEPWRPRVPPPDTSDTDPDGDHMAFPEPSFSAAFSHSGRVNTGRSAQPPPDRPPASTVLKVAIWGASQSGKSTYLWVLPEAAENALWTVTALDAVSETFISKARAGLSSRRLPAATGPESVAIRWRLATSASVVGPPWRRRKIPGTTFTLETVERQGSDFPDLAESMISQLVDADAILFLFDPYRELDPDHEGNTASFWPVMERLKHLIAKRDRQLDGGKLPHYLSVCVTKLDSPPLFTMARSGLWVTQDSRKPHLPRIQDRYAKDFFEWLCKELGDGARDVAAKINTYFAADRVRYFASSAIGFSTEDDCVNIDYPTNLTQDRTRLRSPVQPVNVLEPLLEMARGGGS